MSLPEYIGFAIMPFSPPGKSIEVNVIAGSLYNYTAPSPTPNSWAANPENDVSILTIKLEAGASWILPKASLEAHRNLYYYKGIGLKIEGETIPPYHSIQVKAETKSRRKDYAD